jgi:predicted DNA-binding protein
MVKKISISLPEELFKELANLAKETGRTKSFIITEVLKAYFGKSNHYQESKIYPTALQKLKEQSIIRLRSPKLAKVRIKSDWTIESEV